MNKIQWSGEYLNEYPQQQQQQPYPTKLDQSSLMYPGNRKDKAIDRPES